MSEFIQAHGYILLPALALSIVAAVLAARNTAAQPLVHWLYLRLPFIRSLVQDANIAQFTRTFGTLLRSGVHIDEAARVTRDTLGNYYYRRALESVRTSIEKGGTLSKNLELYPALFPPLVSRLIRVGETTGKTADTLLYLNRHFESKMDVSLKTLTTALEPALLLVIGSVVAFVALAILTPIFELTSTIGNQ